jgi:iron-sulfur cluster repair protein YtfE (RIC family)
MTHAASKHTFRALQKEHDELHEEIAGVQQFWTEVNELGRGPKYEEMAARVQQLRERLRQHFAEEERGGYLAPVIAVSPEAASQVEELKQQHHQFLDDLDGFSERLQDPESLFHNWDEVSAEFEEFLSQLREHESAEMALMREASS